MAGAIYRPFSEGLFFEGNRMWKIILAFAIFAGLALFILSKGGDIDMGGEKHGDISHTEAPAAAAPAAAASAAK
jgi:hypothetical protein